MPLSATVGTSGASGVRSLVVTASGLMRPAFTSGREESIGSASRWMLPAARSASAGPPPRYATTSRATPVRIFRSSTQRCPAEPRPVVAKLKRSGSFLARAKNSPRVRAGTAGAW